MLLTTEELQEYMYDPNKLQQVMLDNLEKSTNGEYVITEPTNPFVMLMELAVTSGANAITEPLSVIRQLYPDISETYSDLYHHVSDNDLDGLFSMPAEVPMVLYINVKDLYSYGSKNSYDTYTETILPIGTEITVNSVVFTILNNIHIKLYKEGGVFVEQQANPDLDISIKNLGVLPSGIVNFTNGEPWIVFETIVKQVKKHTINKPITPSEGFDIITNISNKYTYSNIEYKNNATNNQYVKLTKSHSKAYIDRTTPTCYIEVAGENINFKIPDVYLIDGVVSGNVKIDIYETLGKIYLPINKFGMEEFKVDVTPIGTSEAEASIANIHILANSRTVLDGGIDSITVDELRNSIITNSTGSVDVPVTDANIKQKGLLEGFDITKALDVLTDRVYVASKNLPDLNVDNIYSRPDVYFNTVGIKIGNIPQTSKVLTTDDYLIIRSGCMFKETNGVMSIVDDLESEHLHTLPVNSLIAATKNTKYFYTPYFYVIDTTDVTEIRSTIYKLDNPFLENVIIKSKNPSVLPKVNIDKFTVKLDDVGYSLYFSLISNDEFKATNLDLIKGQLGIKIYNSDESIYIKSDYDKVNNLLIFKIESDLIVDSNDTLVITNGVSSISSKNIPLITDVDVIIYSLDTTVVDENNFLRNELMFNNGDDLTIFGKEQITLNLGSKVKNMWNMLYNTFTEMKYQKYQHDTPLRYEEDVYDIDPDTGSIFRCEYDSNGDITPVYNILHNKDDLIHDDNGDIVFKHRAGDIIVENDIPLIDNVSGVIRNIDIMMIDYEYKLATTDAYKNYLDIVTDTIDSWVNNTIAGINDKLLENTVLMYKSYKKAGMVRITSNNTTYSINYNVKPIVKLYVKNDKYSANELIVLSNTVGNVLHDTINKKDINLITAKESIINKIGSNIVAVKITNIDTVNDSEIFSMYDDTKRLVINKLVSVDEANNIVVRYDIDIKIISI